MRVGMKVESKQMLSNHIDGLCKKRIEKLHALARATLHLWIKRHTSLWIHSLGINLVIAHMCGWLTVGLEMLKKPGFMKDAFELSPMRSIKT